MVEGHVPQGVGVQVPPSALDRLHRSEDHGKVSHR